MQIFKNKYLIEELIIIIKHISIHLRIYFDFIELLIRWKVDQVKIIL